MIQEAQIMPSFRPPKDISQFFKDPKGQIVIAQFPNGPLWVWLGATLLESLKIPFIPPFWISSIGFIAILYWAGLEVFQGVNYFRRCLGLLVAMIVLMNRFG
jgi:hypothetical protein